ncbi:MAG: adenosylcobinamide-phosphate synthase CbiB [Lachnospiraceae bacterium]|nr:adenosylcobinamide-phosphate synthase CbiB [Lachnospiraceae bacterium]MDD5852632.1 adenosylcobinamide-phosphate synthase CbiB [Lachnospiraceae bacterium]
MKYHLAAFFLGFIMDLLFGDPYWLPHPIRLIGNLIAQAEKLFYKDRKRDYKKEYRGGCMTVLTVLLVTGIVTFVLLFAAYRLHPLLGAGIEMIMTYQILAIKSLKDESMKVYDQLQHGTLENARHAVSMIVGRNTQNLTEEGITKAAVETVAENTSDGVIAPMLYTALGGPVLGFLYKAVNTMDSMIGYKNDRYLYFGRAAAKLDDAVNFIPARISACLMVAAAVFLKGADQNRAWKIYRRDSRKHASPNSAQTESVCAGALGIQLAGDASYFGKIVKKPYIGDPVRKVETEDIKRTNRLMYITAFLCEGICVLLLLVVSLI